MLLVALALVGVAIDSPPSRAAAGREIADGFTVASGSRVVGRTAVPFLSAEIAARGWSATLEISGPAATVFDAYVEQARALGYEVQWSDKACSANTPGDVRCRADGRTPARRVDMQLRVCVSCSPPIGLMVLSGGGNGRSEASAVPGVAPTAREPLFEVQLTAADQAALRASLPKVGEPVSQGSRLNVVKGSTVLSSGNLFLCNSGSVDAVVRVTGHAAQAFRQYVKQLPHESPLRTREGRFEGGRARQALGDWGSVRMLERPGAAVIAISECFDD